MTTDATARSACPSCAWHERRLKRAIALQEKRLRVGRPVDLAAVRRAREDLRACAASHDRTPEPA